MQMSKIDAVINQTIDKIRGGGRGFVLDLAAGAREQLLQVRRDIDAALHADGNDAATSAQVDAALDTIFDALASTCIEVRETLPPIDEYIRPSDYRRHHINDTDSFITYAKRYGDKEKSLVFYDESGAVIILDEQQERGERERALMRFDLSAEWKAWSAMLNNVVSHKTLLKHLLLNSHTLATPEILESVRKVRTSATVDTDSTIQEDAKSLGVIIKTAAGEDLAKFPRQIDLHLPVLQQDIDHESSWVDLTLRLNIELPDDPRQNVSFTFTCAEWQSTRTKRITSEGSRIQAELDGFTCIHGAACYEPRSIGRVDD